MKFLYHFLRIILALIFIVSGFVKSVDPLGVSYKMIEYLYLIGIPGTDALSKTSAVLINLLELSSGLLLLFNFRPKISLWLIIGCLSIFTPLTLYLYVNPVITDCGCFGEFIKLNNEETFWKNVGLLVVAALLLFKYRMIAPKTAWLYQDVGFASITSAVLVFNLYSITHLPILDFTPYKVGTDLNITSSEYKLKDLTSGKTVIVSEDSFNQANTLSSNYEVLSKVNKNKDGVTIREFPIFDTSENHISKKFLEDSNYIFAWVISDVSKATLNQYEKIQEFYKTCNKNSVSFVIISGSSKEVTTSFCRRYKFNMPLFYGDDIELKTIVRSNPGLVLLKKGVILNKWHRNSYPPLEPKNFDISNYK